MTVPGIYRWRIEQLMPVWISSSDESYCVNQFHEADCYLVLFVGNLSENTSYAEPIDGDGGFTYNLHYWIGKDASIDKRASVCFRAVQLNSYIGEKGKHFHEQQGEESDTFLSYFSTSTILSSPMSGFAWA